MAFRARLGPSVCLVAGLLCGCTTLRQALNPGFEKSTVAAKVEERMGVGFGPSPCPPWQLILPNGACLEDGLEEEEAVLIALWNNAAFQELLLDLGVARGDLITAGLLPNPTFLYYFNVPFKPYRWLVDFPLESLWLRPIRIKAARREAERVQERLTQAALDLIRDVRQAYADVLVAQGRYRVAEQAVTIRSQIARFAQASFKEENATAQEVATAAIAADQARQDAVRAKYDVALAEERLRNLLAIGAYREPLQLDATPPPLRADLDAEALTAQAVATRPDILATNRNVAAAAQRVRLSRLVWINVLGIIDATTGNLTDHELAQAFALPCRFSTGTRATSPAPGRNSSAPSAISKPFAIRSFSTSIRRISATRRRVPSWKSSRRRSSPKASVPSSAPRKPIGKAPHRILFVLQATDQVITARLNLAVLHGDLAAPGPNWSGVSAAISTRPLSNLKPRRLRPAGASRSTARQGIYSMTYRHGVLTGIVLTIVVLATAAGTYWLALSKPAVAAKAPGRLHPRKSPRRSRKIRS